MVRSNTVMVWRDQTKFNVSPGPGLLVLGPSGPELGPDLGPGPGPELDNLFIVSRY